MHAAVVAVGPGVVHLVVVEQLRAAGGHDGNPLDGQDVLDRAFLQTLDDAREPVGVDRLQEIVERLDGERIDGVPLVRGHEHDGGRVGALAHEGCRLDAAQPRHLDVEEDDVGREVAGEIERLPRAGRLADDMHSGLAGEQVRQLRPRRRFVVDEQRADHRATGTSSRTTVPNGKERSRTLSP